MWNLHIGVDIEDINRFENKSQKFLDRVYTTSEQQYCLSKALPASHFAVRFCAKEALIKALSPFEILEYSLNNIEIYHDKNGCPKIRLLNKKLLNKMKDKLTIEVSLSHDRTKAIAFVTVRQI